MKCLTLQTPWPDFIFHSTKRCENRSWKTTHLGQVVIHAGSTADGPVSQLTERQRAHRGHLIGVVDVVGYDREMRTLLWDRANQWHWRLDNVQAFPEPIPFRKGRLGLFEIDDAAVLAAVKRALA